MSLFDRLGMISHFTIKGEIILQKIWRSGVEWDEEVSEPVFGSWKQWIENLRYIHTFEIPRCYSSCLAASLNIQLHTFCDASEEAYAAVCFLRIQLTEGVEVSFMAGKSKVNPLKSISTPRSELEAAVLGIRLVESLCKWNSFLPQRRQYWTDSSTVYHWVRMDGRNLKPFVSHGIGEIQESSEPGDWKWLPTHLNVADNATRLDSPTDFSSDSRWKNGAEFIRLAEEEWPRQLQPEPDTEVMELNNPLIGSLVERNTLIDITRFSNSKRLIRTTAYVLRCITWMRKLKTPVCLTPEEVSGAEKLWWKRSQRNAFITELNLLQNGKTLAKGSKLSRLSPFLDLEGILRMKSRVEVDIGSFEATPVLLDSKEPFTRLLIRFYHERAGHIGRDQVTNALKEKICIPWLRVAVRSVWSECQMCKNLRVPRPSQMAALSSFRLETVYIRRLGLFWPFGSHNCTPTGETLWSVIHLFGDKSRSCGACRISLV